MESMTPTEKATELVDKYYQLFPLQKDVISIYGTLSWDYDNWKQAKKSALLLVDELIYFGNTELLSEIFEGDYYCDVDFFEAVKKEIENL